MARAERLPIAQVRIDSPLPHLDRVFDYEVPAALDEAARPGVRVRLRFSGRLVNGFIVGRSDVSDVGRLRPIDKVVSPEVVLTAEVMALVEATAARYAGTFSDVVRLAVPPRHARAEAVAVERSRFSSPPDPDPGSWAHYSHGPALVERLRAGRAQGLRGVWSSAPGQSWIADVDRAVRAVLEQPEGGVVVVLPDAWDVEQLARALDDCRESVAVLSADLGPERRYREFCRILRGGARVVIGTRSAVFAPVPDLRLLIVWDDGNDLLWEPHAPYWNARDVAALRSHHSGCALLVGSPSRTPESMQWCDTGWAQSILPARAVVRERAPIVRAFEPEDQARDEAAASARIPRTAWLVAQEGVRAGPVLIQVARRGYLPVLVCASCREPARCGCGGGLAMARASSTPSCQWCGRLAADWRCAQCGGPRLRAGAVGVERTAEEIGRAFPGELIIWSGGDRIVREVPDEPAIVVATPGAEPLAERGYAAVVILDARTQLQRSAMRATEEAAHRWFAALLLARPRAHAVITADNAEPAVQALARWDAGWLAQRELADRASAGLPPSTRAAVLRGDSEDIAAVSEALHTPHRLLGPVGGRGIVLVERDAGAELARELRAITASRAAKAAVGQVTVVLDPRTLDA